MDIVKVDGLVGEQMFQYAFAKALAKHNHTVRLDVGKNWIGGMFPLSLRSMATTDNMAKLGLAGFKFKIKSMLGMKANENVCEELEKKYNADVLRKDDTYFDGVWASYRYFDSINKDIVKDFTVPIHLLPPNTQDIIKRLESSESVAIHVFRPTSKENTCTRDYYNWSIAHIRQYIENPKFYIITDDLKWVKENIILKEDEYEALETPAANHYAVIPLLSHAKHNIIANTLDSWWTGWLNTNSDKIVIAPQVWSNSIEYRDLIPNYWISIPVV